MGVSQSFGQERWWALEHEFADGSVVGAEEVAAQAPEAVHDGSGVRVAASRGAGP